MPWTVVVENIPESMVSQERERLRGVEKDTEVQKDRGERGRPWQGKKEGGRDPENDGEEEQERDVRKPRASHSVSVHKVSGMGGRGERVSGISSAPVMAQCRGWRRGGRGEGGYTGLGLVFLQELR